MTRYKFVIPDRKFDGYRKFSSLLFIVNAIVFLGLSFMPDYHTSRSVLVTGGLLLAAYALYQWRWKRKGERSFWLVYLITAVIWATETTFYVFAVFFVLLLLLQTAMEKDASVLVAPEGVRVNRLFPVLHAWPQLQNVILKDGLLTIDLRSNKLLQVEPQLFAAFGTDAQPVLQLTTADTNAHDYLAFQQDFNDFCRSKLRQQTAVPGS